MTSKTTGPVLWSVDARGVATVTLNRPEVNNAYNGALIEGKLMTLQKVRVGRFTVPNTSCVVLQEGLSDPPTILGMSFLSHFVVKLRSGELYLTEVTEGKNAAPGKGQ